MDWTWTGALEQWVAAVSLVLGLITIATVVLGLGRILQRVDTMAKTIGEAVSETKELRKEFNEHVLYDEREHGVISSRIAVLESKVK